MGGRLGGRHRRGFTLVEVLVGMVALSILGLTLMAGERWLLLAGPLSSRRLIARDRGRRVIAFVEPRLLHAGLGLAACRGTGALQRALGRGMDDPPLVARWPDSDRALRVYEGEPPRLIAVRPEDGVLRGTGFCVLYARPSGMIVNTLDGGPLVVSPGESVELGVLSGSADGAGFRAGYLQDLRTWAALPLSGMPFHLLSAKERRASLCLADHALSAVVVPPVSELLSLRCERFCVKNGTFLFQGMTDDWSPSAFYPREEGVLALWVEWRPGDRTFDLWVLASGGPAVFGPRARPAEWPKEAPWKDDFGRHELYVSRASWRLENL